ncbi:MAG: hypothetical protein SGPRY_007976, partial [Prymnesium sp.]
VSPRISGFCGITGMGVRAQDVWCSQKTTVFFFVISHLLPETDRGYEQAERELGAELMQVPTAQAESCVNKLVIDYGVLQDLRRRIVDPASDEIKAPHACPLTRLHLQPVHGSAHLSCHCRPWVAQDLPTIFSSETFASFTLAG